jgi:hypothetical protein
MQESARCDGRDEGASQRQDKQNAREQPEPS